MLMGPPRHVAACPSAIMSISPSGLTISLRTASMAASCAWAVLPACAPSPMCSPTIRQRVLRRFSPSGPGDMLAHGPSPPAVRLRTMQTPGSCLQQKGAEFCSTRRFTEREPVSASSPAYPMGMAMHRQCTYTLRARLRASVRSF